MNAGKGKVVLFNSQGIKMVQLKSEIIEIFRDNCFECKVSFNSESRHANLSQQI